jgi:hypothetical protein
LAMNEMQTPWSMDQTKEKVIRNRFDILKIFLQKNKYHHTTLKLCSKQQMITHLFWPQSKIPFSSKRFHINHIRCWKSTKISKLNSAKSWKLYFRQKKKPTGLQLSTTFRVFRKGRLLKKLVDIHGTRINKCHYKNSIATFIRHRWTNSKKRLFKERLRKNAKNW